MSETSTDAESEAPGRMTAGEKLAFRIVSASTVPVWAAMILFPNSRLTERLVRLATPLYAALGVAYVGFLAAEVATGEGGMPSHAGDGGFEWAIGELELHLKLFGTIRFEG